MISPAINSHFTTFINTTSINQELRQLGSEREGQGKKWMRACSLRRDRTVGVGQSARPLLPANRHLPRGVFCRRSSLFRKHQNKGLFIYHQTIIVYYDNPYMAVHNVLIACTVAAGRQASLPINTISARRHPDWRARRPKGDTAMTQYSGLHFYFY